MKKYRVTFHYVGGGSCSTDMVAKRVTDLPNQWSSCALLTIVDQSNPDNGTLTVNMRNVVSISYRLKEEAAE
ncbi:hypothetical protein [Brevibacillus agri]|uniref:hypothetical protein n=1 Tax=Brevibacillus agri TaxID=51101 RepID=UPI00046E99C7|nr:hypothetical protein [Brevibacillus agri]